MITVYIPDNFVAERAYAVNTLLHHQAGYAIKIFSKPGLIHYELVWEGKSIIISDHFFGKIFNGESYLQQNRIPEKITATNNPAFDGILSLYGEENLEITPNNIVCDIDLFAGAFFMLTRWEESFGIHEDLHGRFPASQALAVKEGFILRPIVDEYVMLLRKWISALGYDAPAYRTTFAVIPTCDVDIPYYWHSRPTWRLLAGRFLKHKSFRLLMEDFSLMKDTKRGEEKDPYDTFNYLMSLAEDKGLKFIFHMIGGGETKFEGYYDVSDHRIISLMNVFSQRGHQIGLHPSYNAFNDPVKIEKERRRIEKYCGENIKTSRQHYLRFAVPDTWRHLHKAFIKEDSTLGYAAEPGFRCGTCKPFPVFDIHQRKELPLTERPLLIMDVSLKMYKQFSIEESKLYCQEIIDQVKKHNGELVILWHNSSLSELDGWDGWNEVLELLISSSHSN